MNAATPKYKVTVVYHNKRREVSHFHDKNKAFTFRHKMAAKAEVKEATFQEIR